MLCNSWVKWNFVPKLTIDNNNIEVVEEMKIVEYVMRSDMRTSSKTAYLTAKVYNRMWFIRRLKPLGARKTQLLDALQKQVVSVLWLPAWFWRPNMSFK